MRWLLRSRLAIVLLFGLQLLALDIGRSSLRRAPLTTCDLVSHVILEECSLTSALTEKLQPAAPAPKPGDERICPARK